MNKQYAHVIFTYMVQEAKNLTFKDDWEALNAQPSLKLKRNPPNQDNTLYFQGRFLCPKAVIEKIAWTKGYYMRSHEKAGIFITEDSDLTKVDFEGKAIIDSERKLHEPTEGQQSMSIL